MPDDQNTMTRKFESPFGEDPVVFHGDGKDLDSFKQQHGAQQQQQSSPEPGSGQSQQGGEDKGAGQKPDGGQKPDESQGGEPGKPTSQKPGEEPGQPPATESANQEEGGEPQPHETPVEEISDEEYFADLSQRTGYQINNDREIVETITRLKTENEKLRSAPTPDPTEGMSPLLKEAYEFEKKGGDPQTFFQVASLDQGVDTMGNKDLLKQQFFMDHPDYVQVNRSFAEQKFDREFQQKYGIVNENLSEEDFDDTVSYHKWLNDKEYAENELKFEAEKARKKIKDMRQNLDKQLENAKNQEPDNGQPSEEQLAEVREKWVSQVSQFKAEVEGIQLPLDAEGNKVFNMGLNNETRPIFEKWLENPHEFLQSIGISSDGKTIDIDTYGSHVMMAAILEANGKNAIGPKILQYVLENTDRETLESYLLNPAQKPTTTNPGGARTQTEEQEALTKLKGTVPGPYKPVFINPNQQK